jgi:hypothetical protein
MVLRGKQFRRSGPAGCGFLTRQASSVNRTGLTSGSRIPFNHRMPWTSEIAAGHTKDSRAMPHERVLYVMGILGNRERPLDLGGHAPGLDGHPLIQEHQE